LTDSKRALEGKMTNKKGGKDSKELQLQDVEFEAQLQELRDWNRARIQQIKKAKDILKEIYKDDAIFIPLHSRSRGQ